MFADAERRQLASLHEAYGAGDGASHAQHSLEVSRRAKDRGQLDQGGVAHDDQDPGSTFLFDRIGALVMLHNLSRYGHMQKPKPFWIL